MNLKKYILTKGRNVLRVPVNNEWYGHGYDQDLDRYWVLGLDNYDDSASVCSVLVVEPNEIVQVTQPTVTYAYKGLDDEVVGVIVEPTFNSVQQFYQADDKQDYLISTHKLRFMGTLCSVPIDFCWVGVFELGGSQYAVSTGNPRLSKQDVLIDRIDINDSISIDSAKVAGVLPSVRLNDAKVVYQRDYRYSAHIKCQNILASWVDRMVLKA